WQRILDFGTNSAGENNQGTGLRYLALIPRSSGGFFQFSVTTNSSGAESSIVWTNMFPTGQQTHVVLNYNAVANTSSLYLNGQRIATGAAPFPLSAITDVNVWLGRSQWVDPYFNGSFDEFRIYNGPLSDAAIASSFVTGPDALYGPLPTLTAN